MEWIHLNTFTRTSLAHLYNIHYIDVHDGFSITPLSFHFTNINVLSLNNLKEK